jgi:hypothetical protein
MKLTTSKLLAALAVLAAAGVQAQGTAKDIVLDSVTAPAVAVVAVAAPTTRDALAVSVLLESPDGSLQPKSVSASFATGDRFRVKLLAARDARVALYNTNPAGQFNPKPVWQGRVQVGQETITPRLRLDGRSGVDQLHVVLEPDQAPQGVVAWITQWLAKEAGAGATKDIVLDSQETPASTYLVNRTGQGLVTTIRIVHH